MGVLLADLCTEHPRDRDGNQVLGKFAARHGGRFGLSAGFNASAFFGCCEFFVSRAVPGGGTPILYYQNEPLDGGYTYTWLVDADAFFCNKAYDVTLFHPR